MTSLPPALHLPLLKDLACLGDSSPIQKCEAVGGGCINHASRLITRQNAYFLKWNTAPLPGMFQNEAAGLRLLSATHTVPVPTVFALSETTPEHPAYLLLEWLESRGNGDQARLGEQLAEMHRWREPNKPAQFGLDHDNYVGSTPQHNQPDNDWPAFFIQQRLLPQMQLSHSLGLLHYQRRLRLEKLCERIPELLQGITQIPSLIHGDLWGGNVINSPRGLALIDPAVSYSDREAEIAFTELFGGFSASFYQSYQSAWPLQPGYADRRDLYNLYHLLNHLNLFGESYGHQVDSILSRYTSLQ
jgi:fructosamine-3-kinase